jgi:exopolysaccharide biosynthesis polyprenyl glycosylphosphotransferase
LTVLGALIILEIRFSGKKADCSRDMLERKQELNTQILQVVDALLLAIALLVAYGLRLHSQISIAVSKQVDPLSNYYWLLIVVILFGPILLEMQGFYQSPINRTKWKTLEQIGRAMIALSIVVGACVIFLKQPLYNRTVPVFFILIATFLLLTKEHLMVSYFRGRAARGELRERILLAGVPEDIAALEASFAEEQRLLTEVVARIDIEKQPISDLVEAMHHHAVSRVIFAAGHTQLVRVEQAIGACEVEGVPAWLGANFIQTSIAKPDFDAFAGKPMLVFRSTPDVSWSLLVKGIVDRLLALIGIAILLLPMAIVALVIRATSKGPAIFRQLRAGKHGKPFVMYKFRSMADDAEMRRAEMEPFNQMHGPVFKVEHDPRITPFGRWLRRTSMDELPQLFNVLFGDMSLVGPRPLPTYEIEKFQDMAQRRRLSVKPGMTCLWQISGRNQVVDFREWVRLDLDYIDRWSLGLDFKILLRTIPAVISGLGAK